MKTFFSTALFCGLFSSLFSQNQPPVISNVSAQIDLAAKKFDLTFNLFDAESDSIEVVVELSSDGGQNFDWSFLPKTGDLGWPIFSGVAKKVSIDLASVATNLPAGGLVARVSVFDRKPFDFASLVAAVDESRLKKEMQFILGKRHRTAGAAHLAEVQDSLQKLMKTACLALETQAVAYPNYQGQNIFGKLRGFQQPATVYVIDAHYDTVSSSPGADDNGSGTVGMIEAVRVLSHFPCRKSLFFIGFDLEETGLTGSKAYNATGIASKDSIGGAFNFEMIAHFDDEPNTQQVPSGFQIVFPNQVTAIAADSFKGNFITHVSNDPSAGIAAAFNQAATAWVPSLKVVHLPIPGTGSNPLFSDLTRSDHASFWLKNRPALMLTDGAEFRNPNYHKASDTIGPKFNFQFMGNVVRAAVAAVAGLAGAEHGSWAATVCLLPTVSVDEKMVAEKGFRVWPNPADEELFFEVEKSLEGRPFLMQVVDSQGVTVFSKTIFDEKSVSLAGLGSGVFLVRALFENGEVRAQKLIFR